MRIRANLDQHSFWSPSWPLASLVLALVLLFGCSGARESEARAALAGGETTPAKARRLVREQGALLLDVRSAKEFAAGHVEGAQLLPHDEIATRVAELDEQLGGDRTRPLVVYCRSGRRSSEAKATLEQAGFTQVIDLGAMSNWCEDC